MDTRIQVSRKAAVTAAGTETDAALGKAQGQVFVLEDLIVHEVSSVDVPANKRRWLMIKNAQGNQGDALVPDGKGGFITKSQTAAPADGAGSTAASVVEQAAADGAAKTDESAPEVTDAGAGADADGAAPAAEGATPGTDNGTTTTEVEAAKSEVAVATPDVDADGASAQEIEIDDSTAAILEGAAGVMKAGRKISAERKARLRQIAESLQALIDEVEEKNTEDDAAAKAMREMQAEMQAKLDQVNAKLAEVLGTNKQLTDQVAELQAATKGTGTVTVQAEKAAPPVSGQFDIKASATKPASTGWIGLQRELAGRGKQK